MVMALAIAGGVCLGALLWFIQESLHRGELLARFVESLADAEAAAAEAGARADREQRRADLAIDQIAKWTMGQPISEAGIQQQQDKRREDAERTAEMVEWVSDEVVGPLVENLND